MAGERGGITKLKKRIKKEGERKRGRGKGKRRLSESQGGGLMENNLIKLLTDEDYVGLL